MKEAELAETVAVIPGVLSNIQKAVDDLTDIIGTVEESLNGNEESLAALKESEEWKQSEEQIKLANEYLESLGEWQACINLDWLPADAWWIWGDFSLKISQIRIFHLIYHTLK